MRRHALLAFAAAAVVGLALAAASDPMELFGWGEDLDTYDFVDGIISSDGAYVWMVAEVNNAWVAKYMTNPSDFSPTCECSTSRVAHRSIYLFIIIY